MSLPTLGLDQEAGAPEVPPARLIRLGHLWALVRYLALSTETHAFCAGLAFFSLLAFYPLSSLLLSLAKHGLGPGAQAVVVQALREYYPEGQAFLLRNLEVSVAQHGRRLQPHAVAWILLGAAGFFVPLETAFNRLWGAREHRPYWRNQGVGFLLTGACALLAVSFVLSTAGLHAALAHALGPAAAAASRTAVLRATAVPFVVAAVFLFYRFLPNRRVRSAEVLPAAFLAGVTAELVRSAYAAVLPWLALPRSQGPYYVSVSFALLAYVEAFVLLGGAFLASARDRRRDAEGGG